MADFLLTFQTDKSRGEFKFIIRSGQFGAITAAATGVLPPSSLFILGVPDALGYIFTSKKLSNMFIQGTKKSAKSGKIAPELARAVSIASANAITTKKKREKRTERKRTTILESLAKLQQAQPL